ncbi:squalene/phytoene synthase family protein [Falsirhodobacter sp. 20TX0035]|uniref:squalene/phytoene synthase family protein n=1 Tax=Falsirhodobacter sp. 20TX0035 TaxID=3022019 RepID=UPI00232DB00C|nr:squalene/phytoene synthase family protein [Falsirhodobacter sp. 20TX0035]MDB6453391.1 squalene/phytoene synthase family protein [Falsirhodobacter sp. 20TX0035]
MSLDACAALVAKGDPDRFAALMAAPVAARARLLPLYAFNLEVARAPWASAEPMIAEMRLQWWADVVEEIAAGVAPAHEVAAPLATLVREQGLPTGLLAEMVEARRADIYDDRPDDATFAAYIDQTAGHLMWLSALAFGTDPKAEGAIRNVAWAQGLATMLQAYPQLAARGRQPLPTDDLKTLVGTGLKKLKIGRSAAKGAAVLPAWQTKALLQLAQEHPEYVPQGRLKLSEIRKRGLLLWHAFRYA